MRRIRKTFKRPRTRWDADQIRTEREILRQYGLRRKRELWKAQSVLRGFRQRARQLNAVKDDAKITILVDRLSKLGLIKGQASLDDVLSLSVSDLLERRLQTLVVRKGMAKGAMEARQVIVHGRIAVDGRQMISPSYLVPVAQEQTIGWHRGEGGA